MLGRTPRPRATRRARGACGRRSRPARSPARVGDLPPAIRCPGALGEAAPLVPSVRRCTRSSSSRTSRHLSPVACSSSPRGPGRTNTAGRARGCGPGGPDGPRALPRGRAIRRRPESAGCQRGRGPYARACRRCGNQHTGERLATALRGAADPSARAAPPAGGRSSWSDRRELTAEASSLGRRAAPPGDAPTRRYRERLHQVRTPGATARLPGPGRSAVDRRPSLQRPEEVEVRTGTLLLPPERQLAAGIEAESREPQRRGDPGTHGGG